MRLFFTTSFFMNYINIMCKLIYQLFQYAYVFI